MNSEEPYLTALNGFSSHYKEMQKVRNHIVHNSINRNDAFDTLVRNKLGPAKVGIGPAGFLMPKKNKRGLWFFEQYIGYIKNAAMQISEYLPPKSNDNLTDDADKKQNSITENLYSKD